MKEVKIPLDLSCIKSPDLKKFIQLIDIYVILEIEDDDEQIRIEDDYIMHGNHDFGSIPTEIRKKSLIVYFTTI